MGRKSKTTPRIKSKLKQTSSLTCIDKPHCEPIIPKQRQFPDTSPAINIHQKSNNSKSSIKTDNLNNISFYNRRHCENKDLHHSESQRPRLCSQENEYKSNYDRIFELNDPPQQATNLNDYLDQDLFTFTLSSQSGSKSSYSEPMFNNSDVREEDGLIFRKVNIEECINNKYDLNNNQYDYTDDPEIAGIFDSLNKCSSEFRSKSMITNEILSKEDKDQNIQEINDSSNDDKISILDYESKFSLIQTYLF